MPFRCPSLRRNGFTQGKRANIATIRIRGRNGEIFAGNANGTGGKLDGRRKHVMQYSRESMDDNIRRSVKDGSKNLKTLGRGETHGICYDDSSERLWRENKPWTVRLSLKAELTVHKWKKIKTLPRRAIYNLSGKGKSERRQNADRCSSRGGRKDLILWRLPHIL